jgi:hypothetical protein
MSRNTIIVLIFQRHKLLDLNPPWFNYPNYIWREVRKKSSGFLGITLCNSPKVSHRCQNLKSYILHNSSSQCNFLHTPVTWSLLGPNILLSTLLSNTVSLCSYRSVLKHRQSLFSPYSSQTSSVSVLPLERDTELRIHKTAISESIILCNLAWTFFSVVKI